MTCVGYATVTKQCECWNAERSPPQTCLESCWGTPAPWETCATARLALQHSTTHSDPSNQVLIRHNEAWDSVCVCVCVVLVWVWIGWWPLSNRWVKTGCNQWNFNLSHCPEEDQILKQHTHAFIFVSDHFPCVRDDGLSHCKKILFLISILSFQQKNLNILETRYVYFLKENVRSIARTY